jgi:hypothetical protein
MKAWGKHPLRTAHLWVEGLMKCRNDATLLPTDYHEVRYEFLLRRPESELRQICNFLGLEYEEALTSLRRPVENLGDTQQVAHIASNNTEKWRDEFSSDVVKEIEEIGFDLIHDIGYPLIYATQQTRLTSPRLIFLKAVDAWNRIKFDCRRKSSLTNGLLYQYRKRRFG